MCPFANATHSCLLYFIISLEIRQCEPSNFVLILQNYFAILVPLPFLIILESPWSFLQKVLLEFLLGLWLISIKFAFNFKCFSWVKYMSANSIPIRKQISFIQQKIQWILNMCWLSKDIRLLSNDPKNPRGVGNIHWLEEPMTLMMKELCSLSSIKEIWSVISNKDKTTTFLCCQVRHKRVWQKAHWPFFIHLYSHIQCHFRLKNLNLLSAPHLKEVFSRCQKVILRSVTSTD